MSPAHPARPRRTHTGRRVGGEPATCACACACLGNPCVGAQVLGWGSFTNFKDRSAYAPTAEISVYVADGAAGRGVGSLLVDGLLARAPGCGIDRVLAITFEHNEPSLRLFRKKGFTEWGRLPDACELDGVRRSVLILGLAL